MKQKTRLAIIGSGASAIFILKNLLERVKKIGSAISEVHVFERDQVLGTGMPYSRKTTDRYNLCNISSAEIPALSTSLVQWLESLDDTSLARHGIDRARISESETYSRVALGEYFQAQYAAIVSSLDLAGIPVIAHKNSSVIDIEDSTNQNGVRVISKNEGHFYFERVIIATGHVFRESDEPQAGYYASPWPMQKLLPPTDELYNFTIGTIGASLSAFDVVASLANRHGSFEQHGNGLIFHPNPKVPKFRIVMHSSNGWLPHLQYEQDEAFREIYRHTTSEQMLSLRDASGFLMLSKYFDKVCRPALISAFVKDNRFDMAELLHDTAYGIEDFVSKMTGEHEYNDPFAGMQAEMPEAEHSLRKGRPIHWKEVLDDLMFTLNFHFDWLPAEDVIKYRQAVVPFLMNVIAAMPLQSAQTLLALSAAGRLELIPGHVSIKEKGNGFTVAEIDNGGHVSQKRYKLFVDCTGQGTVDLDDFPFPSLVRSGAITEATARFANAELIERISSDLEKDLVQTESCLLFRMGGIAIDGYYRVIDKNGESNRRIYDIAFPHATGIRPYSYGLQACNTTAAIVVDALSAELDDCEELLTEPINTTQAYDVLPKAC